MGVNQYRKENSADIRVRSRNNSASRELWIKKNFGDSPILLICANFSDRGPAKSRLCQHLAFALGGGLL
jgi:hypothetical protein